ncbi:flagellar brake protein [Shewanella psychropiezotolerans]|uniref:Flagellar brake protein n=1 Tax=Shewanella psychropiezotolerans TaxID=2593655 RepID=A0ABX5WSM1_9GAMM|nr:MULTISPECIES: flagellar brake domain-containing protein [Shewanella]MPY26760.1 flagellar brake protein [Shewanella sp. YLB-07]QDO82119.1 flagellar brake protein [Shewanella psychropiezotolerans]
MPQSQAYEFSYLDNIACNTEVHIQILTPTQPIRLRTRLVGVDPHVSIILALGSDKLWQQASDFIVQDQGVIIRIVKTDEPDANVIAFKTCIQKLINGSGRWLLVDYPKEIQKVALRQHSRISINVESLLRPASSEASGNSAEAKPLAHGNLSDISIKGGAFVCKNNDTIEKEGNYLLQVKIMPDMETLSMSITVKNAIGIEHDKEQLQYGFIINSPQSEAEIFVQKVILNHLLKQSE